MCHWRSSINPANQSITSKSKLLRSRLAKISVNMNEKVKPSPSKPASTKNCLRNMLSFNYVFFLQVIIVFAIQPPNHFTTIRFPFIGSNRLGRRYGIISKPTERHGAFQIDLGLLFIFSGRLKKLEIVKGISWGNSQCSHWFFGICPIDLTSNRNF